MGSKKLARTVYRDLTVTGQPVRDGFTTHGESNLDLEEYLQPVEQVHGSGLHEWGVGFGLHVTLTSAATGGKVLKVEPGIALDARGRHISLASGTSTDPGYAEVGTPTLAVVAVDGVTVPTTTVTPPRPPGYYYVTIEWLETLDTNAVSAPSGAVWKYNHTPWVRLEPILAFVDNGDRVVLARVELDAANNVTKIDHTLRREVSLPAGAVRLRAPKKTVSSGKDTIEDTGSGELRARSVAGRGGIEVVVPNKADQIDLFKWDPADPTTVDTFAKFSVAAEAIVARRSDGKETVAIDTAHGNITVGTQDVEGDILVKDRKNRLVITLDGETAAVVVGAEGHEGDVVVKNGVVKDGVAQNSVRIDGAPGDIWFRGLLRDVDNAHPGVGHALLKHLPELTNGQVTSLHKHQGLGNATRAIAVWLFTSASAPVSVSPISLPSAQRVFAFIAIRSVTYRIVFPPDQAMVFADIPIVDGTIVAPLPGFPTIPGPSPPFFSGQAQTIQFRLFSTLARSMDAQALAVVFPEE